MPQDLHRATTSVDSAAARRVALTIEHQVLHRRTVHAPGFALGARGRRFVDVRRADSFMVASSDGVVTQSDSESLQERASGTAISASGGPVLGA